LAFGVRFDDRVTGKVSEFAKHGKIVHIDIDPSEINKNKPANLPIVSDVKYALGRLADGSFVYVYGAFVTPDTIARYLLRAGAVEAMVLDMNSGWPAAFTYTRAGVGLHGHRLNAAVTAQPSQYLQQNRKDFIAVLSG